MRFVAALIAAVLVIGAAVAVALETGFSPFEPVEPTAPTTDDTQEPFDVTEAPAPSDNENQPGSTAAEPVAANFFQIVASAMPGNAKVVDQSAGAIEINPAFCAAPDPYLATWYDPTIRGRRTVDEVIGGDYTATLAVQASNLSSITLQIEGYDAWLRQDPSSLYGNQDTYYDYGYGFRYEAADLSAWDSATLTLANVSVPEDAAVEDYQLPINVSVLVDTPPSLLETRELSQTDAEGDSGNTLFRTHPTWSNEYALQFETLIGNALANCRITITAIYEDGTHESGVYVIAPVADFSQRYAQYLDNQDVYRDEVLRLQSEGLVDEARAFQMPKTPALFTITRVG